MAQGTRMRKNFTGGFVPTALVTLKLPDPSKVPEALTVQFVTGLARFVELKTE